MHAFIIYYIKGPCILDMVCYASLNENPYKIGPAALPAYQPQTNELITLTGAITNQIEISDYEEEDFQNDDILNEKDLEEEEQDATLDDSDVDNMTIASLIELGKLKPNKLNQIPQPENRTAELKEVLKQQSIKVKDLVK